MTTQEFINELQEVSPLFSWSLEPDSSPYAERRSWPRLHLRGTVKEGAESGLIVDSMGAVWYARTGQILPPKSWAQAGDALGLLPVRAAEFHAAGNDITWAGAEGKREPVEYLQALRARLIAAVGLAATKPPARTVPE